MRGVDQHPGPVGFPDADPCSPSGGDTRISAGQEALATCEKADMREDLKHRLLSRRRLLRRLSTANKTRQEIIDAEALTAGRLQYLQAQFAKGCGTVPLVFLRKR